MARSRWTRRVLAGVGVLLLLSPLLVLAHPRGRATLRLAPGFHPLEGEPQVWCEEGAEELARTFARALTGAAARVEQVHGRPLTPGYRVYVCATHESFTAHVGHPVATPVRGIAFLWDVWVSPKAFAFHGRDTHRETLAHELSHLHLNQHLGWWGRVRLVPSWFGEGLADLVADSGEERLSREDAVAALLAGRQLTPHGTGTLWPRGPQDHGLTWPLFHQQSRMLVEHLASRDPGAFRGMVDRLLDGTPLGEACEASFGETLPDIWRTLVDALREERDRSEVGDE